MFDPGAALLLVALAAGRDTLSRAPSSADSVLASVISPLVKPGDRLRLRSAIGATEGVAGRIGPGGLQLRRTQADGVGYSLGQPIAWSEIERIDLQARRPGEGAKAGSVLGCLLGLATAMSVGSYAGAASGYGPRGGDALAGAVVGGIAGACVGGILGGLVDSAVPEWKTVFERR